MNTIPIEDQFPRHDGMTATDWINHAIALEWHGTTPPNITFADGGPVIEEEIHFRHSRGSGRVKVERGGKTPEWIAEILGEDATEWQVEFLLQLLDSPNALAALPQHHTGITGLRRLVETYIPLFEETIDQPPAEPPRADGKPHVPKPSTTPPMWANNPTKQRRRR